MKYSIIYEYGAVLDKDCLEKTEKQFDLARGLYNNVIEIITKARNEADSYIRQNSPEISKKMQEIETLNARFDTAKALQNEPEMKLTAEERREVWRALTPMMKEARKVHRDKITEIFSVVGLRKECLTYQARCKAVADGLGSATADDILATAIRALDKVRKDGGRLSFRSVKLRKQDHIINRFAAAGGVLVADLLAKPHSMVGLVPPAEIKDKRYGEYKFRIGSAKAEEYATGMWQYCRPFPDGAKVTTIRLVRKRLGPNGPIKGRFRHIEKWALQFQISLESLPKIEPNFTEDLCAIHLGFSLAENGRIRIAATNDREDPGFAKFIDLPENITADLFRSEQIRKTRDINRDTIHAAIKALSPSLEGEVKEEFEDIQKLPAQHVAIERIKRVSRKMEGVYENETANILREYTINDHHLYALECNVRKRALNRRKNFYRHVALDLAKKYRVIVLGRYDLKKMALKRDADGELNELAKIARKGRFIASLYQFQDCLKWACMRAGSVVIADKEIDYARTCAACGSTFEREGDRLECENCGAIADIKANAAAVLYAKWKDKAADEAEKLAAAAIEKQASYLKAQQTKLERMRARRNEGSASGAVNE